MIRIRTGERGEAAIQGHKGTTSNAPSTVQKRIFMISNKGISLLFTVAALIATAGAVVQGQQKSPKPTFDVRYKSGSFDFKPGTWFRLAFLTTEARQGSTKPLVSVASEQITTVQFSAKTEKDSHLLEQMSRSGCAYARSMRPKSGAQPDGRDLIVFLASPGAVSRLAEKLNRRHPIRFVWNDDGSERALLLTVNDCEYAAFLANLRQFLGLRWQKVAAGLQ